MQAHFQDVDITANEIAGFLANNRDIFSQLQDVRINPDDQKIVEVKLETQRVLQTAGIQTEQLEDLDLSATIQKGGFSRA